MNLSKAYSERRQSCLGRLSKRRKTKYVCTSLGRMDSGGGGEREGSNPSILTSGNNILLLLLLLF